VQILYEFFSRVDNLIDHALPRNCFLKHVIERKLEPRREVTVRRRIRGKQLLDELKEKRVYWKLEEEALDRTVRRSGYGRECRPFVRQTTELRYTETFNPLRTRRILYKDSVRTSL